MSVPSKVHNVLLVQIQPEERLAATSELNLASCLVTGCGEARGRGYWAATQVNKRGTRVNAREGDGLAGETLGHIFCIYKYNKNIGGEDIANA